MILFGTYKFGDPERLTRRFTHGRSRGIFKVLQRERQKMKVLYVGKIGNSDTPFQKHAVLEEITRKYPRTLYITELDASPAKLTRERIEEIYRDLLDIDKPPYNNHSP